MRPSGAAVVSRAAATQGRTPQGLARQPAVGVPAVAKRHGSPAPRPRPASSYNFAVDAFLGRGGYSSQGAVDGPLFTNHMQTRAGGLRPVGLAVSSMVTSGGGSVQRMNRQRIKLLVTLVLLTLAVTSVWLVSQADARGLSSPGASSSLVATRPGASLASGDPDSPQGGVAPPPPPTTKSMRGPVEESGRATLIDSWVQWTGRIWATMKLKAAR